MTGYETWEVSPGGWRRLFPPAGAVWVLVLQAVTGGRWLPDGLPGALPRPMWTLLGGLAAWGAAGFAASALGTVVERVRLARGDRVAAWLVRARQRRWDRLDRLARAAEPDTAGEQAHSDAARSAARHARRRWAVSPQRPIAATWAADRWARLDDRIRGAYGLAVAVTWPRLWLLVPEPVRAELRAAAAGWHAACVWGGWAALFGLLGLLRWPVLGVAVALAAWSWAAGRRCLAYRADLIESAYDLHGTELARQLRVALPASGRLDALRGQEVTVRLGKGS
ncbi:hypothetical protein [Catellatospora sp. NPDC049609]|uniref:hypothetical protein n=1 Tax=Catellatospora sp. NPDC049609 TaxID=3155505 RepID=UPI00342B67FB